MTLRIRVDDFPYTKDEEREKHSLEAFKRFADVIDKHVPFGWLLGVIPGKLDPEDDEEHGRSVLYLHSMKHIEIGMHGIFHDERYQNEFLPHQTRGEVTVKLRDSRLWLSKLFERETTVYIPPHNMIDAKTVWAAADAGFKAFTGGPETDPVMRRDFGPMKYLHSEAPLEYGRSDELLDRGAVSYLSRETMFRDVLLTIHWTWETNIGLDYLDRFLTELRVSDCFAPNGLM